MNTTTHHHVAWDTGYPESRAPVAAANRARAQDALTHSRLRRLCGIGWLAAAATAAAILGFVGAIHLGPSAGLEILSTGAGISALLYIALAAISGTVALAVLNLVAAPTLFLLAYFAQDIGTDAVAGVIVLHAVVGAINALPAHSRGAGTSTPLLAWSVFTTVLAALLLAHGL